MKRSFLFLFVLLGLWFSSAELHACNIPGNVSMSNRSGTSITINFSSSAPFHQVEYGTMGFAIGNGNRSTWASSTTFQATSLEPSTGYDFYVRDSCSDGTVSNWTSYYATSTLCGVALLPWFENFDQDQMEPQPAWPTVGPGSMPNCWPRNPTTGYGWVISPVPFPNNFTGPSGDHSGRSKYALCDVIGFTGNNTSATLRTPQVSLGTASSPELSFWYHLFGNGIGSLEVQVKSVGTTAWTTVKTITGQQQSASTAAWINEIISLNAFAGDTIMVRFKGDRNSGFTQFADIAIDDIHIRQGTGCAAPANFILTGTTSSTASFSWLAGGGSWSQISYGTGSPGPGTGTVVTASGNPASISGLSPNTTYQAYVRDSCSLGSSSTWIGPITFTTDCVPVTTPYTENFDGTAWGIGTFGQSGTIQGCWNRNTTTDYFWTPGPPQFPGWNTGPSGDHTPAAGGKYVYTETSGFLNGTTTLLTSPAIDLSPLDTPEASFWYHMYGADISGLTLEVSTGSSWTTLWSVTGQQQTSSAAPWLEAIIDLSAYVDDTIKLRWTGTKTTSFTASSDIALDDLHVYERPSCPKPSNFATTGKTANSVTLSWTATGGSAPWQIVYGAPGFSPSSGTVVTATSNPFTVTGLSGSTPYQFYLRDTCGVSGASQWVGPLSAITLCTQATAPWSDNFSGAGWVQSSGTWNDPGDIALCWNRSDTTGYYWTPRTGATPWPNTGPNSGAGGSGAYLHTNLNATSPLSTKITTPWIDLTPVDTPALYFWSHLYGSNITNLKVEINDGSGWINLTTLLPGNQTAKSSVWDENIVNLYAYRDDTVRFRFTANRSSGWWAMIGLDNIEVDAAPPPTCVKPSTLSVASISPTGATISFSTLSGYSQLAVGLSGFSPGFSTLTNPNASSPYAITGLLSNTSYDIYVRDSCGPGLVSAWKGPLTFSTLPCPAVSASFNFSGMLLTRIFTAQGATGGNSYSWDFGDGSTGSGSTKTHSYSTPGTYTVTLIVSNSCGSSDTIMIPITVCGILSANYSSMVAGQSVAFTAGGAGATGYYWEFGDGATGTGPNPVHSYAASGLYTATLRAYNLCGDTASYSSVIVICNLPTAEWTANIVWSNGSGMKVQFDAGFSIGGSTYTWFFGDGTQGTGQMPSHIYAVAGLFYQVTLVVANDCGGSDTLSKSLTAVGLDDVGIPLYGLWPNPVAPGGRLMIQGLPVDASFQITDALGRIMDHSAAEPIGDQAVMLSIPANWPGGLYFLRTEETTLRFAVTP